MAKHSKSKSLIRKQFAFALSQPSKPESQKVIKEVQKANRPELAKASQISKTKQESKSKQETLVKGTKESQTVEKTKGEPFKAPAFQESDYQRLREWIEREGLDKDDAYRLMEDSGQPMTYAQQALLDRFEADGIFSDVEVEEFDEHRRRLTA